MKARPITAELYSNLRIAIQVWEPSGEPYCRLSVNLPEAEVGDDEFCLNREVSWPIRQQMLATGRFVATERSVKAGFGASPVWKVACPALLQVVADKRAMLQPQ